MSDLALIAGWVWFIAVGVAWTFLLFVPWSKRVRRDPRWPPPEPPMRVQLRFIAKLLLGALVVTALIIGLVLWEPLAGFGLGALLFHGYLTVVMKMVESYNERLYGPNSPTDGTAGGGGAGGAEGMRAGGAGDGARPGRGRRR